MQGRNHSFEALLSGAQRRRLRLARENGHLNAACPAARELITAHARWCWMLRIPVIHSARPSPRSRSRNLHLDLYTTPNRLTAAGQAALRELAPGAAVSPHDAHFHRVPGRDVDRLAAAVLRVVTRPANYQRNLPARQPAKLRVVEPQAREVA